MKPTLLLNIFFLALIPLSLPTISPTGPVKVV